MTRPHGENYLNLVESLLALLAEGGVPSGQAAWGVDILLQFGTATAAEHATRQESLDADDEWEALVETVRTTSAATHPQVAALAGLLVSGEPGERLSWGFRALINGIVATPAPEGDAS